MNENINDFFLKLQKILFYLHGANLQAMFSQQICKQCLVKSNLTKLVNQRKIQLKKLTNVNFARSYQPFLNVKLNEVNDK